MLRSEAEQAEEVEKALRTLVREKKMVEEVVEDRDKEIASKLLKIKQIQSKNDLF